MPEKMLQPGASGSVITERPSGIAVVTHEIITTDTPQLKLYDTTLRDGQQGIDVNYSVLGKLRVARAIHQHLPVSLIEGGWPGANGVDTEFFQRAQQEDFFPILTAFGMTRRAGVHVESDTTINNLLESGAPTVTIVGKSDIKHVQEVFKTTKEENLAMIEDSIKYVREQGREVIYDAEHFFDGYLRDPEYALETLRAAARGGAKSVVLCDTNGGRWPKQITDIVTVAINDEKLHEAYRKAHEITDNAAKIEVGIHTHADRRFAEANSLAAIDAGATHVQGTIAGLGERAGNADLLVIADTLSDMGIINLHPDQRGAFVSIANTVFEASGADMRPNTPLIGPDAFASKAGMHQDAMIKDRGLYNFREPREYGNEMRIVINSQSGKRAVAEIARQLDLKIPATSIAILTNEIKDREHQGYRYTRGDGSLELLMRKYTSDYQPPFSIEVNGNASQVTLTIPSGSEQLPTATAEINTPTRDHRANSYLNALRDTLIGTYPELEDVSCERSLVQIENGTKRVFIKASNGDRAWTTVGIGSSIEEAAWKAAADALEFALYHPPMVKEAV